MSPPNHVDPPLSEENKNTVFSPKFFSIARVRLATAEEKERGDESEREEEEC